MTQTTPAAPRRDRFRLGTLSSLALTFNGIVGGGIFILPSVLFKQFGAFSPWLFPSFGLAVLLLVVPFARLASLFEGTGGPVAYTGALGLTLSFQAGWIYYAARAAALAANATVFAIFVSDIAGLSAPGWVGRLIACSLVATVTLANLVNLRRVGEILAAVTALKILPLVLLAIAALIKFPLEPLAAAHLPRASGISSAAVLILYAFVGFETAVVPAGETRNPRSTIPRALILGVALTAFIYFLVQLAFVAAAALDPHRNPTLIDLGRSVAGPAGAITVTGVALVSILGNLFAATASTARVTVALSARGALPPWFASFEQAHQVPRNSVLFLGGFALALALTGDFVRLAALSTLARLIVYCLCIASLPKAARQSCGGRLPALTYAVAAGGIGMSLWAMINSSGVIWMTLVVLVAAGLVLQGICRQRRDPLPREIASTQRFKPRNRQGSSR